MQIKGGLTLATLNPIGWEDFGFVREFEVQGNRLTVNNGSLELVNEDRQLVYNWIYNEWGRFIGFPIEITNSNGYLGRFYLNLRTATITDNAIKADLVVRKGNDNFYERAQGLTFEEVYKKGFLTDADFKLFPFLVVQEYTNIEKIALLATLITTTKSVYDLVKDGSYLVAEILNPFNIAALVVKGIAFLIYAIAVIILLVSTIKEIKALVYPKLRNFKMCSDYRLIQAGCNYLGFTLDSYYIASKSAYHTIPVPTAVPNKSIFDFFQDELTTVFQNQGYPTALDGSIATLWGLIDDWLKLHNLEMFVNDGIVKIETPSYFDGAPSLTIPSAFSLQEAPENEYTFNNEVRDIWRRKYLQYSVDYTDSQSIDIANDQNDVRVEYITEPINIPAGYEDLVQHTGFYEVISAHAMCRRKNALTNTEKTFLKIAVVIDNLAGSFDLYSNLQQGVNDRKGVGMIGSQWFSVPKRVYCPDSSGKQPSNYQQLLSLGALYNSNHADYDTKNQNRKRYSMTIPMSPNDFDTLQTSNRVILEQTGEIARVMSASYKDAPSRRTCELILQVADNAGFNTKTTKLS